MLAASGSANNSKKNARSAMCGVGRSFRRALQISLILLCACTPAEAPKPNLTGMWSDPPAKIADTFCMFWCTDAGLARLDALLDDPASDEKPIGALYVLAATAQRDEYLRPRFTDAALQYTGLDPADDPGFLECEPWGFAREIFAPHQLKIEQMTDRVEMQYGEWTIRRTIYLDGREPASASPTAMGHSVGHYDGEALVIETSSIRANLAPWGLGFPSPWPFDGRHSEQLRVQERYSRSADGESLLLTATMEDPWALREPVVLKKVWQWAPDQEISPYESCEKPTEFTRGTIPK